MNKRNSKRLLVLLYSLFLVHFSLFAQPPKLITAGFSFKPIFPVSFLRTGTQTVYDSSNVRYDLSLKSGFNAGMVIRKGLTNLLSIETGINYVKRRYSITITDTSHIESSQFSIIGYEIPVSVLASIRLGEYIYMTASMGVSPDVFASNVQSFGDNHRTETVRRTIVQAAVIANIGWEARTNNIGFFYLGASFHGPLNSDEFVSRITYPLSGSQANTYTGLSGNYLTVDIRYFFPPEKKNKEAGSN